MHILCTPGQSSNPSKAPPEQLGPPFTVPQTWPVSMPRCAADENPSAKSRLIFRQREFSVGCCQESPQQTNPQNNRHEQAIEDNDGDEEGTSVKPGVLVTAIPALLST
ncbi:hypothetical protein DHEL01_v211270 [Diaporthe helianthi]|uniref:Uncharacterized protein n=1 Tax=Diaporthe helianthi TaxID=158607 RepID=A0A2P5HJA1_DIAHE|nr:hypothetical protein DHEL01_v211270 [Diaporthe helianthi]